MKRRILILFLLTLTLSTNSFGRKVVLPDSITGNMQWFADAKLVIFIHCGIYSVKGIGESWSSHNRKISYPDYMCLS